MIGLNREIPKTCFECPCFATYAIDKEGNPNIQYLIRYCQAANQPLLNIEWDTEESVPDIWTEFSKPQWCPWQEIDMGEHDDEYSWHHSMAGFGGDY